jgi:two-component system, OmpR family, sensor kinase
MSERPRIRTRLATWYAASMLLVLLVAIGVLRVLLGQALDAEFHRSQIATGQLASRFFRAEIAEYRTPEATLAHIASELVPGTHVLEFVRPDGSIRTATGTGRGVGVDLASLASPVRTIDVTLDAERAPGWTVRVHSSASELEALRARIDRGAVVAAVLVGILAWLAGWGLAGRTLRPVAAMADSADRISPAHAGQRLPIERTDDELGRLGTRFNALLDRLDGVIAVQRRFLGDAAHELRTPLARMRSRVDVARLEHPTDTTLTALDADLRRMATLVTELLHLARADAATEQVPLVQGWLDDVVSDEWRSWVTDAERAGVALTLSQLDEASVRMDRVLLARLVGVLIDNALRYTPRDGAVDVRVGTLDDVAMLVVEDTGIGIEREDRERVTERFVRGGAARAIRPDGSGLGLAIASDIVEQHGATLAFDTPPSGRGTRVVVRFPLFIEDSSAPATLAQDANVPPQPALVS